MLTRTISKNSLSSALSVISGRTDLHDRRHRPEDQQVHLTLVVLLQPLESAPTHARRLRLGEIAGCASGTGPTRNLAGAPPVAVDLAQILRAVAQAETEPTTETSDAGVENLDIGDRNRGR